MRLLKWAGFTELTRDDWFVLGVLVAAFIAIAFIGD